jgi:hypothetical protein
MLRVFLTTRHSERYDLHMDSEDQFRRNCMVSSAIYDTLIERHPDGTEDENASLLITILKEVARKR